MCAFIARSIHTPRLGAMNDASRARVTSTSTSTSLPRRPRASRIFPTPHRVAVLVLAIRCALDPIAREETREETWRARGVEDEDENECFDDVDRDPRAVLARRVMERSGKSSEGFVVAARRAWARCATEFLLETANEGGEHEGEGEEGEEETGDGARARWRRDGMFEPGPWEMVRRVRALARRAFEDAGDEDAGDDVERWCVEVFLEELDLATVSLDALERCFEDARAVVLNARVDAFDDALGLEMWGLEEWTPTSTFLKTCHLGFTSAPFEATTELLRTTRAYLDAAVRVENGIRDGCDWREARREDDAFRACAAPDALMALACRATARYDARGVDADAVLPRHRLDVLAELAPEMPTIHYLKHAEALHRRDFPAAVEHLHRHFDASGEHVDVRADLGSRRAEGEFESANAGRERLQTALLALATTHFAFSHVNEAMSAISEAVRTAQQNGDETSLAHALALTTALMAQTRRGGERDAAQLPTLLRRCAAQAAELSSPHLVAYASLALTKYEIDHPSTAITGGGDIGESKVVTSTPTRATRALIDVELTRHAAKLASSTPASTERALAVHRARGDAAVTAGSDVYPTPKGFPSTPASAYAASSVASAMASLTATASVLTSESWHAHGCSHLARMYALRQLMHDDEASADDAATSCARLLASTSEREGARATEEVMDIVRDTFGARGERHKTTAVAFLKLEYERAIDRGEYGAARRAARRARALVGFGDGADAELDFESRRMNANLDRVMKNFDAAQDELRTIIKEAELCGDEHAVMRATLTLAETHLSADAPTLALTRALPLERLAAERGLEPIRATVTCIACEAWLALGGSHARLARDTLDERSLALLSSDCLRTQARAYAACARALVATTPECEFPTIARRVVDALERACERYVKLDARCDAARAYASLADAHWRVARDATARDAAARRCRAFATEFTDATPTRDDAY